MGESCKTSTALGSLPEWQLESSAASRGRLNVCIYIMHVSSRRQLIGFCSVWSKSSVEISHQSKCSSNVLEVNGSGYENKGVVLEHVWWGKWCSTVALSHNGTVSGWLLVLQGKQVYFTTSSCDKHKSTEVSQLSWSGVSCWQEVSTLKRWAQIKLI